MSSDMKITATSARMVEKMNTPATTPEVRPTRTGEEPTLQNTVQAASEPSKPSRFPWLSRVAQHLEAATNQKRSFRGNSVLGDQVDTSA